MGEMTHSAAPARRRGEELWARKKLCDDEPEGPITAGRLSEITGLTTGAVQRITQELRESAEPAR